MRLRDDSDCLLLAHSVTGKSISAVTLLTKSSYSSRIKIDRN